jgi:tetratricopeptide (TPR) repeat protein
MSIIRLVSGPQFPPVPEEVTSLWDRVKKALLANEEPTPRQIDRMATTAGCELAESTIAGWFRTWSVVPAWEKFEALIKALGAEQDEDWRSLHHKALIADRERKKEQRRRAELSHSDAPAPSERILSPPEQVGPSPAELTSKAGLALHQLPAAVTHFTGRVAELAKLDVLLTRGDAAPPAAKMITAIVGTAGVGKTALVVHWAHRVRDHFPDGQLFVNLRGSDPGAPTAPEQALEEFLRALGVSAERIPASVAERAALYRSLLDGRRMLIVLDNADSANQVRPLLPGSPTCRAIVTSRNRLSGLIIRDGASRISLDLLSAVEANALLRDIIGEARVATETNATDKLASLCAYLPLALRIAAERAVTHPYTTLTDLVSELTGEHDRVDLHFMDHEEDEATAVRAVFSWSYHALTPEAARAFRLLGLHAGPDISAPAAAALINTTTVAARRLLEVLVGTHLIEETERDRYRFHDLLRVYAADRAEAEETGQDRGAAVQRVLTWYLHTADAAGQVLSPHRRRVPLDPPEVACSLLDFPSYGQALDWCEAERANLVAATYQAAETGEHLIACKLPLALWDFFNLRKHWADLINTHRISLTAAQYLHDRRAEAWAWGGLGYPYFDLHQPEEALIHFQRALSICQEIDEPWGEAISLLGFSRACYFLRRHEEALGHSERALRICQEINDAWSQIFSLLNTGTIHRKLQRTEDALNYFQQTLTVARAVQDRSGEAMALHSLGDTYRDIGRFEDSLGYFQRACPAYREIGDQSSEARVLRNIGDALLNLNRLDEAAKYWDQALLIFKDLGDWARTAGVRDKLEIHNTDSDPDPPS